VLDDPWSSGPPTLLSGGDGSHHRQDVRFGACWPSLPRQLHEPTRPKEFFGQLAADLGGTPTPVMFNAYSVNSGRELVFCNEAASGFIGRSPEEQRRHVIPGEDMLAEYRRIDAETVRTALWLSLYGFSNRYQGETARLLSACPVPLGPDMISPGVV